MRVLHPGSDSEGHGDGGDRRRVAELERASETSSRTRVEKPLPGAYQRLKRAGRASHKAVTRTACVSHGRPSPRPCSSRRVIRAGRRAGRRSGSESVGGEARRAAHKAREGRRGEALSG